MSNSTLRRSLTYCDNLRDVVTILEFEDRLIVQSHDKVLHKTTLITDMDEECRRILDISNDTILHTAPIRRIVQLTNRYLGEECTTFLFLHGSGNILDAMAIDDSDNKTIQALLGMQIAEFSSMITADWKATDEQIETELWEALDHGPREFFRTASDLLRKYNPDGDDVDEKSTVFGTWHVAIYDLPN